jgi:hypothetical protein
MNSSTGLVETATVPSEIFFITVFSLITILILIGSIISLIIIINISMNNTLQSVSNLLSCNSCALGLFYCVFHMFYVILAFHPLPTYRQNSILCQIIGYLYSVTCCGISWSHAILGTSRLCYSLFSQYRWLRTYKFAWYLIAVHWILTFTLPFPFLFFNAYQYQHESRICILTTRQTSTSLAGVILFYNIPFTAVIIVYILVWCHARRSTNITVSRATRDVAIMRHILTLVIIDTICGHPYITLIVLDYFDIATKEWYLLVSFFITLSVTANMCAIFIFNRKLRHFLCSKWLFWRTSPSSTSTTTSAMIPMRTSAYILMTGNIIAGLVRNPANAEIRTIEK